MGLESGTYINDLVVTNPVGSTDPKSQGDDHLRLIKNALKNSFPGTNKPVYLDQSRTDVASASTTNLAAVASNFVNITGTTTITSLGSATAGITRWIRFAGALTLTDSAGLVLPTGNNISTTAGDHAFAVSLGSGNWVIAAYFPVNGKALIPPTFLELALDAVSDLTSLTTIALDDVILVGDQSDTGEVKGMVLVDFLKGINLLDDLGTSVNKTNDKIVVLDASNSNKPKTVNPEDLTVGNSALADLAPGSLLAILEDRKSSGTNGGSTTGGAFADRDLNTEVYDRLSIITVASPQFTITAAGDYEIYWEAPCYGVRRHKSKLRDVTNSADIGFGSSEIAVDTIMSRSCGYARVTIAGSTIFKIQSYPQDSVSSLGFGISDALGVTEIYSRVVIRKG